MSIRLLLASLCVAALPACTANDLPARPVTVATPTTPATPAVPATPATPAPASPTVDPSKVDLAALDALLRRCYGDGEGHPLGTAASAELLGSWGDERVFQVRMSGDASKPVLLFEGPGGACPAFVLGPPAATVQGDFLGDGTKTTVAMLSQVADGVSCSSDACPIAFVLRDAAGDVLLGAVRAHQDCELTALKQVRLFDRGDSLELRCTQGSEMGVVKIQLLHAFERTLRPLLVFDTLVVDAQPAPGDRVCTYRSKGGYTIKKRGPTPVLDVTEVLDIKEGMRGEWTFVPEQQRLVAGERRPEKLPAPGGCEPL